MAFSNAPFGPTPKTNEINGLVKKPSVLGPPPGQIELFHVEKQIEFDGVEMGVLDNGTPYLSESGLARMCGIDRKVLNRLASNWVEERTKERGKAIDELLQQSGYTHNTLYLKSELGNGYQINAYTEPVCLAVLEYYAFISKEAKEEAKRAFRALARVKFREYVYGAVGYSPEQQKLDSWKHFHDRVDLTQDSTPIGYFGVFNAVASLIVPMIRDRVPVSEKVVPDISIGMAWSKHWTTNEFDARYGARTRYEHNYPSYYPQAESNPQEPYAYPDAALGEFRNWLRTVYIKEKLPPYLIGKAKKGEITAAVATRALLSLSSNSKVTALPKPR